MAVGGEFTPGKWINIYPGITGSEVGYLLRLNGHLHAAGLARGFLGVHG